jgi:hypothetical protein
MLLAKFNFLIHNFHMTLLVLVLTKEFKRGNV